MTTEKKLYQSKTIWGVIISIAPTLLALFGVPVPPGIIEAIGTVGVQIIQVAGAALAGYGRVEAKTTIAPLLKKANN